MKKEKNKKYGKDGDVGKVRKILFCFMIDSLILCASACGSKETIQLQEDDMVLLEESGAENKCLSEEEMSAEVVRSADEEDSTKKQQELMEETGGPVQEQVEESTLFVHICGEVIKPGVYELPEGSRVYEAVEAAGGFTDKAAESYVNLAQVLEDGKKIRIPDMQWVSEQEEANPAALQGETVREETAREEKAQNGLVDINRATKEELCSLPGVGESRAESIIAYREKSGGFSKIEDIMQVEGIKEGMFARMKDKICVTNGE